MESTKRETASDEAKAAQEPLTKSLVLIGMMGVGKSSVGKRLATHLGVEFVDVDNEIELVSGREIAEIFEEYGEAEFRALETRVLARLLAERPRVIATGGGAFLSPANRELIENEAISVWMDADLETIWARVKDKTHRPLLNNDDPRGTIKRLMDARNPIYAEAAHKVISLPDQSHEEMVMRICKTLGISGETD